MKTLTTDKSLNISLTEKEFRQLIFLGNLGAHIYMCSRTKTAMKDKGVNAGFELMYKLAEQGGENGIPILGNHGRLNDVIDTEVMNESMRFAKYVMANQEFFKLLEKKLAE